MSHYKYSEQQLRDAIQKSTSIRQTLIALGMAGKGGNYRVINKAIIKYNIDISHFTGKGWSKNKHFGPKRKIEDYLNNNQTIQSYKLKNRLIKEHILEEKCIYCNLTSWLGSKIPLELDHINGNHSDNNLSNLRLLCPNCHSFTDTYRGKNARKITCI